MPNSLFAHPQRLYSIPTGTSFVDALALGLIREAGTDPLALSAMTILLPTRRGCRALQEAFLRQGLTQGLTQGLAREGAAEDAGGGALLLPRFIPIGDLDEDALGVLATGVAEDIGLAPALSPLRRRMLLAELIQGAAPGLLPGARDLSLDQAAGLAAELMRLVDQIETERLDLAGLAELAPADLAHHWQLTLSFLDILRLHWPGILAAEGAIEPAQRRNFLLERQCALWRESPPQAPVIAAGSTGSILASADLIATVATLPKGLVVLPGLDAHADAKQWEAISRDPAHPQFGLAQLLTRLERQRADVLAWPALPEEGELRPSPPTRARLVAHALLPAEATQAWPDLARALKAEGDKAKLAWRDVRRIDCRTEQEEAGLIALLLREAVENPAPHRAALVTPDRALARRVASELGRWGIVIDDSAGQSLALTAPGLYFRLIADALAEDLAPVPLLALLKHPLAAGGLTPDAFRKAVRLMERIALRGPRPAPGLAGLKAVLSGADARDKKAKAPVECLEFLFREIGDWHRPELSLADRLVRHARLAEGLAATDAVAGADRLWLGEAGEALAGFVADLQEAARGLKPVSAADYAALLGDLMGDVEVRPRYGLHPRLFIWGPLEARLQQVDLMILGGLNEGIWPGEPTIDPWLSRPMRAKFGLPSPERKIGLAAHDFQQAMGAPDIVLTRALRVGGKPTVPSRWLLRLDAFLKVLGLTVPVEGPSHYRGWLVNLDRPSSVVPSPRPAPRPGAVHRPNRLSVTRIEAWMRDPYALYARKILHLAKLDPIDQDPGAADLGNLFHAALEIFLKETKLPLPQDAEARLLATGRAVFTPYLAKPAVEVFWWPRFCLAARWFLGAMAGRQHDIASIVTESWGEIELAEVTPPFRLTARVDRIDRLKNGALVIIDYKTGRLPRQGDVTLGFSPQLPLEAVIAMQGGFKGVQAGPVSDLEYWHLSGGEKGGEVKRIKTDDVMALAADARLGLIELIKSFSTDDAAYVASPRAGYQLAFNDYAHLARQDEWAEAEGD